MMNVKTAPRASQLNFAAEVLLTECVGLWLAPALLGHVMRPGKALSFNIQRPTQPVFSTAGLAPHILSCCNIFRCDLTGASVFAQMSPDAAAAGTPMPGCVLSPHLQLHEESGACACHATWQQQ